MKKLILFLCFFSIGLVCLAQKKDTLLDEYKTLKKDVLNKELDSNSTEIRIHSFFEKAKKSKQKELITAIKKLIVSIVGFCSNIMHAVMRPIYFNNYHSLIC